MKISLVIYMKKSPCGCKKKGTKEWMFHEWAVNRQKKGILKILKTKDA